MPKRASRTKAASKQLDKQTLASVRKEMRMPRKTESVRQEEITHLHIKLQRRKAS
jgi:hypothetical protein